MTAAYLDSHFLPLYPFGFGLSYSTFSYKNLVLSNSTITNSDTLEVVVEVANTGEFDADEIIQLYIRDLVGSVTRPIKELKKFKRIHLVKGQCKRITFNLTTEDLAFYDRKMCLTTEPGKFHIWVGGSSDATLQGEFELV